TSDTHNRSAERPAAVEGMIPTEFSPADDILPQRIIRRHRQAAQTMRSGCAIPAASAGGIIEAGVGLKFLGSLPHDVASGGICVASGGSGVAGSERENIGVVV